MGPTKTWRHSLRFPSGMPAGGRISQRRVHSTTTNHFVLIDFLVCQSPPSKHSLWLMLFPFRLGFVIGVRLLTFFHYSTLCWFKQSVNKSKIWFRLHSVNKWRVDEFNYRVRVERIRSFLMPINFTIKTHSLEIHQRLGMCHTKRSIDRSEWLLSGELWMPNRDTKLS